MELQPTNDERRQMKVQPRIKQSSNGMNVYFEEPLPKGILAVRFIKFPIVQSLVFIQVLIWVCKQQRTGKYIGWF